MKPQSWNIRLVTRRDVVRDHADGETVVEAPAAAKDPTIGQVQETIEAAVQARWPWLTARATATRTDK